MKKQNAKSTRKSKIISNKRKRHKLPAAGATEAPKNSAAGLIIPTRVKISSNREAIRHLLARASFGASVSELQQLASASTTEVVANLLADSALPPPPGEWVDEPFDRDAFQNLTPEEQQAWRMLNQERLDELRAWWLEWMMASPFNLREKMTLFWHGHFTSDYKNVNLTQFLYKQNDLLRRHALGNFRAFLKDIYKDPAMLIYLDGVNNKRQQPNENFARELLELFTMGVGNYTETDIKEAARAFTGWQVNTITLTSFINPQRHDEGIKTFMGRSGNFGGDEIIDIILEQPQPTGFICRKFYEFFVSREVNDDFMNELAETFRANDYEIKPVLEQLFKNELFYSEQAVAALIKSPVEMAVNNARMLSVEGINFNYLITATKSLSQELLNPPNVAGWPGQRVWISPTTYVLRNTFCESYVNGGLFSNPDSNRAPIKFDPLAFACSFQIAGARELADAMTQHLLRLPIDEKTKEALLQVLVGTADPEDWSLEYPGADQLA